MGTNAQGNVANSAGPMAERNVNGVPKALYSDSQDALKAVRDDYLYWTGKLTETSVQLSYAVLGANWAVFGSVDKILTSFWCKASVLLVILSLALSSLGAKMMGEWHRKRIDYAETDPTRWSTEFGDTAGKRDPWPFTTAIESAGKVLRFGKAWLPLVAGACFLVALFA